MPLLPFVSLPHLRKCVACVGAVWVQAKGLEIVNDPEKDKSMVQLLLDLKDHVDNIVEHGFRSHDSVMYVGKHAFERIVNARDNRPAEMIGTCQS